MIDLSVAGRIVPELLDVLRRRARILQRIHRLQPIGRRALATELQTTERVLRAEVETLRQQGLLQTGASGMSLSLEGQALVDEIEVVLASLEGRTELGVALSRRLGVRSVYVVAGDSDEEDWAKEALGYQAAMYVQDVLTASDVLAVTGGTTMAAFAKSMPKRATPLPIKVVPARGGLGERVAVQANTIASEIADQIGGTSVMLHVPDRLSEETVQSLLLEPHIVQRLRDIRETTVVVHGIGDAFRMASRRQLSDEELALIRGRGAVAEAFGYYFDKEGQIVYAMSIIGLKLSDLARARLIVGVAGGKSKADAIAAAAKAYRIDVLVTDEGAARQVLHSM